MIKSINKIIKVLIISDLALLTGIGFMAPIFAIFLTTRISGAGVEVAGFAAAIYWVLKSALMIPFGRFLDKNHGEKDDLWFIIIGNTLAAIAIVSYIFSYKPWHIYLLQALYGLGMSMNVPAYTALFTRHIDKGREAFDWAVRGSLIGIGTGVAGALGGIVAKNFGFDFLFIGVAVFILLSALLPLFISRQMSQKEKPSPLFPETKTILPPTPKQ